MNNSTWGDHSVASITNGTFLTVIIDGEYFTIGVENPNFAAAKAALAAKDIDSLLGAVKPIVAVAKVASVLGDITVEVDRVLYNGVEIHNVVVDRILEFGRDGQDVEPLSRFLSNLMNNPSKTAVQELYLFLESSATPMPITEDGHFLAYKRVRSDFKDIYSGTLDYSVGTVVEMPRNEVDDNRDRTCSSGLHFCSLSYLRSYGSHDRGDITLIVKINPADVVSIPSDYNNAKGRTSRMEVIGIHKGGDERPAWDRGYTTTAENSTVPETNVTEYDANDLTFYYSRKEARFNAAMSGGRVVDLDSPKVHVNDSSVNGESRWRRWAVYKKV